ncbi:hypothetical protein IF2G_09950 [Cordyceps javanica]|nr:hypothetical protein IF2G_09950 [Cordyceps javanica]
MRDSVFQQFARSRKAKKDDMNRHGTRVELKSLRALKEILEDIENSLPRDEKEKYKLLEKDISHAWLWASPVQMELQFVSSVLTEMKWEISQDQFWRLWIAQQEVRRTWLKLEMQGDVGLQIHFTARLLHSQLTSDSRLKCGLFRRFEPNGHTQEWLEKSSKVLSLAEASVLEDEMKLLWEWLAASRNLSRIEGDGDAWASIKDAGGADWAEIQRGLEKIGWGKYVPGCTHYSSLTGLMDREFKRLGISPWDDDQ